MNTIIWIMLFLGVIFYFLNKFKGVKADAEANGEEMTIGEYLAKDATDIFLGLVLAFVTLRYGETLGAQLSEWIGYNLTVSMTNPVQAFITGIGIASAGVNAILKALSLLPGISVGNKARKTVRKIAANKN